MKTYNKNNNEQGVAIIISLGILALILALGLNFASQSIINEKASKNVDYRIKADLLLNSGKNMALAAATTSINSDILLSNFYSTTENATLADSVIYTEADSEIKVISDGITYYGNENTQWLNVIKIIDPEPDLKTELVGRIAFTLVSNSTISNYSNIGKLVPSACVDSGMNAVNAVSESDNLYTGTRTDGTQIAGRPGVNVNEIYLETLDDALADTSILQAISVTNATPTGGALLPGEQWIDLQEMFKAAGISNNKSEVVTRLNNKLIVDVEPDPEAFWIKSSSGDTTVDTDELYHRFNLTRTDWPDPTEDHVAWINSNILGDTDHFYVNDGITEDSTCIPWIKNWKAVLPGDTTSDTMKNQIIANLIDYNDSNSIATTDNEDSPSYTGNDKTPYINEINIEIEGLTTSVPPDLHFALIRPRAATVELVNIYTGGETSAKITKVDIGYSYDYDGNQETGTFTLSNSLSINVADNNYSIASQNLSGFRLHTADAATDVDNFSINSLEVQLKSNDSTEFYDYSFIVTPSNPSTAKNLVTGGNNRESIYFDYEVNDPRQNLQESEWTLMSDGIDSLNSINLVCIPEGNGVDSDLETASEPWNVSTAYIRNAPMRSPWELGFIHRAAAWQTINLKKYNTTEDANSDGGGNSYSDGDANILDQIKMTSDTTTLGKVNLNNPIAPDDDLNPLVALFYNIRTGVAGTDIDNPGYSASANPVDYADAKMLSDYIQALILDSDDTILVDNMFKTRAQVLTEQPTFTQTPFSNDNYHASYNLSLTLDNDALQEEIIGKFINLTKAGGKTFDIENLQILIITQTINPNNPQKPNEVMAERRALVTLKQNIETGKWEIVRFEYVGE